MFFFLSSPEDMLIDFGEKGREVEKHQSVAFHMLPTRDWTNNPGMCSDREPVTFQFMNDAPTN